MPVARLRLATCTAIAAAMAVVGIDCGGDRLGCCPLVAGDYGETSRETLSRRLGRILAAGMLQVTEPL